jgi:hypothetical protein
MQEVTKFLCEVGYKLGVSVADDLLRDAEPWHEMLQIQSCDTLSHDVCCAGDKLRGLGTAMVNNREYSIETVQLGQVCDQIHGHQLERSRLGVCHDQLQWGFSMRRAWLVFLASCATVDIICSKFFHPLTFVLLGEEVRRVHDSGVTHKQVVVV